MGEVYCKKSCWGVFCLTQYTIFFKDVRQPIRRYQIMLEGHVLSNLCSFNFLI